MNADMVLMLKIPSIFGANMFSDSLKFCWCNNLINILLKDNRVSFY